MNKVDTYKWIRSIMESCNTLKQLYNCLPLIDSYYKRYGRRVEKDFLIQYRFDLMNKLWHTNEEEVRSYTRF